MTFLIRELDGTFVEREPTVGKWYCGFVYDEQYADRGYGCIGPEGTLGWRDELIAEYIGEGEFYDEGSECDFVCYDWLLEQL